MDRYYFLTVCLTYAVGLLPLVIARALKRAGVSAEYFRGALIVYTRRHVAAEPVEFIARNEARTVEFKALLMQVIA